jgi:hypothetical protein
MGYHRQIVLGANSNASVNFDMGYDSFMVDVNKEDMYWILNQNRLVIQGVDEFNEAQEFPLGIKVNEAGIVKIQIELLENLDEHLSIYIKDTLTNETYNINNNSFDLFLDKGVYNDRFSVVFQRNTRLSIDNDEILSNVLVYYDLELSELKILNKYGIYISKVNLYNLLGQNVMGFEVDSSKNESIPFILSAGTYIVKLNTEKGQVNKKIIIK